MITDYIVLESATGDELGTLRVDAEIPDERLIQALVDAGYLDPPADEYLVDDGYPFTEDGQRVIVDSEGEPALMLELPEDDGDEEEDDEDDDEDDDE